MHLVGALTGRGASGEVSGRFIVLRLFLTVLQAEASAAAGLSRILRERRKIRRMRNISPEEFRNLLKRFAMDARETAFKS